MSDDGQPVAREDVQADDWAYTWDPSRRPQRVTRVDHEKGEVWLDIRGREYGPYKLADYSYRRLT